MIVVRNTEHEDISRRNALHFDSPFPGKLDSCIGTFRARNHTYHFVVAEPCAHVPREFGPVAHFCGDIGESDLMLMWLASKPIQSNCGTSTAERMDQEAGTYWSA